MTTYRLFYRTYRRPFRRPLTTAHGTWSVREGLVIALRPSSSPVDLDDDRCMGDVAGLGEIAPLPWFGSETPAEALAFCQVQHGTIDDAAIDAIPATLPACQFAFESARLQLRAVLESESAVRSTPELNVCRLLPAGKSALEALDRGPNARTHKWKIGTLPILEELEIFAALFARLPVGSRLRLDANGGLDRDSARRWLETCDRVSDNANSPDRDRVMIEFLEQPLPVTEFAAMQSLAREFTTPLALDESVASLEQIATVCDCGWTGIYVIKPAIVGSSSRLRSLCQTHRLDTVFSSVFETEIGRDAGLQLAAELQSRDRAVGYGLDGWMDSPEWSPWRSRT